MRDAPEPLGYLPPAEYEAQYCAARSDSAALALKQTSLRKTRRDSVRINDEAMG